MKSGSLNPQGLSKPVQGLLYVYCTQQNVYSQDDSQLAKTVLPLVEPKGSLTYKQDKLP
jgi:hypothetical protein